MALEDFYEPFVFIEERKISDSMGGFIEEYVESVPFNAGISTDQSIEARVAEQQGVSSVYTITANKNANLKFNDIIKRKKDNKYFRITSNGDDMQSPRISNLDIIQVTAESFTLPSI